MSSGSWQVEQVEQFEREETRQMTEQIYNLYRRRVSELRADQLFGEHSVESALAVEGQAGQEQHRCRPDMVEQSECTVRVGQRVTWFSDGGEAEHGVVLWIGWLRGCAHNPPGPDLVFAGIQFVLLSYLLFFS